MEIKKNHNYFFFQVAIDQMITFNTSLYSEKKNLPDGLNNYTGCPRTGSPEKKGSFRANILTCILKKKSPISNDNREKTF
jgi:hypothetical protein